MKNLIKFIIALLCIIFMFAVLTNPYTLALGIVLGPIALKILCWPMKTAANIIKELGF